MKLYKVAGYIPTLSFTTTLLINSFLIYLTIFHIKLICGTYKSMIIIFAAMGIMFSLAEVIVRPCVHNFNGAVMYFSLNETLPEWLLSIGLLSLAGVYSSLLAFITVMFLFRCWTLIGNPMAKTFNGFKVTIWILFVAILGALYASFVRLLIPPDVYSDAYMQAEVLRIYEMGIEDVTRFIMVAYENDRVRWRNFAFGVTETTFIVTYLIVIGICALRMRREMRARLKTMSKRNRRLETQFFKALLAQSAFPTLLLVLPTGPILLLPLLDLKVSLQSGFLFSLFSLYPPMDSIAMMLIITEYKTCTQSLTVFELSGAY